MSYFILNKKYNNNNHFCSFTSYIQYTTSILFRSPTILYSLTSHKMNMMQNKVSNNCKAKEIIVNISKKSRRRENGINKGRTPTSTRQRIDNNEVALVASPLISKEPCEAAFAVLQFDKLGRVLNDKECLAKANRLGVCLGCGGSCLSANERRFSRVLRRSLSNDDNVGRFCNECSTNNKLRCSQSVPRNLGKAWSQQLVHSR